MGVANESRFRLSHTAGIVAVLVAMFIAIIISPVVLELVFTFAYIALLVVAAFSAARTPGHTLSRRLKLFVVGGTIIYGALVVYHVYEIVV